MGKIKIITLWLMTVIMFASCAASKKVEQGSSEQRRDSTVANVKGSVTKSETRTDSSAVTVTDENHTIGSMTDKGSNEALLVVMQWLVNSVRATMSAMPHTRHD